MTKIGMIEETEGLARYELGDLNGVMYAKVDDPGWIELASFQFGGRTHKVGETFTKLGTRKRRSFETDPGHWLEYAGRIGDLLLFRLDGQDSEWYHAFYESPDGRLLVVSTEGTAYDIW